MKKKIIGTICLLLLPAWMAATDSIRADLWWQLLAEYKKNAKLFGRLEIFSYFCPQT